MQRNILRRPFIKMCVTVLRGALCCSPAAGALLAAASVASALESNLGEPLGGPRPAVPTHGNVDVNGDVGQRQAVAPWASSQLPAQ